MNPPTPPAIVPLLPNKPPRESFNPWRVLGIVGLVIMIACTVVLIGGAASFLSDGSDFFSDDEATYSEEGDEVSCNVYAESLHGMLDTYAPPEGSASYGEIVGSDVIVQNIELAAKDPEVKGVLLDIDSLGGYAVAADEIANALKALDKPSVAVIKGFGDSAAYWAATGADIIIASPISDVGSIGITSSYLENSTYNNKEGFTYQQLSLGKYKDLGDPDKPLTEEERQIIMKQLEHSYNYFIDTVAANRDIPIEEVRALATGQSFTGTEALSLKLIDKLGGLPEARDWLESQIGEAPELCW